MSEEKPKRPAKEAKRTITDPISKDRFDKLLKASLSTPPPNKKKK